MCDFNAGDEVVCVDATGEAKELVEGKVYVVERVVGPGDAFPTLGGIAVNVSSLSVWVSGGFDFYGQTEDTPSPGYCPRRFRKVQRRNLTEWLSQKTKFEEPKRIGENA